MDSIDRKELLIGLNLREVHRPTEAMKDAKVAETRQDGEASAVGDVERLADSAAREIKEKDSVSQLTTELNWQKDDSNRSISTYAVSRMAATIVRKIADKETKPTPVKQENSFMAVDSSHKENSAPSDSLAKKNVHLSLVVETPPTASSSLVISIPSPDYIPSSQPSYHPSSPVSRRRRSPSPLPVPSPPFSGFPPSPSCVEVEVGLEDCEDSEDASDGENDPHLARSAMGRRVKIKRTLPRYGQSIATWTTSQSCRSIVQNPAISSELADQTMDAGI